MTITTSYGSWLNAAKHSLTVGTYIIDAINGGDSDWQERMDDSGALDLIERDFRDAIQAALPEGIWLTGEEFIGPHRSDPNYSDDLAEFDIGAAIEGLDLNTIVERWDVDMEWSTADVADRLGITPVGARKAIERMGIKPTGRQPGRTGQNLYNAEAVIRAANNRPGRGTRTDLA
jgi:hypothetical protein